MMMDAERDQQVTAVGPLSPTLGDDRHAVAKFFLKLRQSFRGNYNLQLGLLESKEVKQCRISRKKPVPKTNLIRAVVLI